MCADLPDGARIGLPVAAQGRLPERAGGFVRRSAQDSGRRFGRRGKGASATPRSPSTRCRRAGQAGAMGLSGAMRLGQAISPEPDLLIAPLRQRSVF